MAAECGGWDSVVEALRGKVDAPEAVDVEVEVEVDAPTGQTTLPVATEPATRDRKQRPKGRRASVPSWDEILFGATRGDDA